MTAINPTTIQAEAMLVNAAGRLTVEASGVML